MSSTLIISSAARAGTETEYAAGVTELSVAKTDTSHGKTFKSSIHIIAEKDAHTALAV